MKKIILMILSVTITQFPLAATASMELDLDTIVVTAARIGQQSYKVAGNVSVLTAAKIKATNAQTIPDVLKSALGVYVSDNGTAKSARVDIRGFGDTFAQNILVLVNGRKINNADISGPDLIAIPLESVERIEIIRGAGSVLYGDNAVGGVVNIITKKGEGDFSGQVGGTYGSYDAQSTDFQAQGSDKDLTYFIYAKYNDLRGYRQNSDLLAKDFNTRTTYRFNNNLSADFNVGWHEDTQELPGGLTDSELTSLGRRETANPNDTSSTKDRFVKLAFDVSPWPEDSEYGKFVIDYNFRNRDVYDEFNGFGPFHTKRNIDTNSITGKYIFDRQIMDHDVDFVTGIDFYDTQNDILGSGDNVDDITIAKKEFGVYGFLEYETFDHIFINAGTRYQSADYDFDQRNVVVHESVSPDEWVSMGGAKYEYAEGANVHVNVQQTFRFLATDEWYSTANFPGFGITPGLNTDLQQQTGIQYELGVKHNYNNGIIATLTPYYIKLKDEIFFDPVTFANSNYDETHRIGVDFGSTFDLKKILNINRLDELDYFTNYSYIDAQFIDGPSDGKTIPFVPAHQASMGLATRFLKYYYLSFIGRYVGSRYAINDTLNETARIKPNCVLDGKIAFKHDNFELFAEINNITDKQYDSYVSKSTFGTTKSHFPAPERNYRAGVQVKF